MCGFAGLVAWDQGHRIDRDMLSRMSQAIAHRGPDGEGIFLNYDNRPVDSQHPQVGLVHRRLAILDPDPRSNQPFTDHQNRWLVFNGEIYNYRELREELTSLDRDYPWQTTGDTEVLLRAYAIWGENCVRHLDGMFAMAVWDAPRRRLFLARDRMGQKPLYWAMEPRAVSAKMSRSPMAIAFASEIPALLRIPWIRPETNYGALADYLCWGYIPAPATIFDCVYKLAPAETLVIDHSSGLMSDEYFHCNSPDVEDETAAADESSAVKRTRSLIVSSVKKQLVSDVPLGCFLSGGVDSSIIAAAMCASVPKGQKVCTFSIGFDDPRYDETPYAAAVARHLGTQHKQFVVTPDAANDLPRLAKVFGEPFADSSALPTHYLSRETRGAVKVALSGDGGDELFGGYDRYRAMQFTEKFPKFLGRGIRTPLMRLPGSHPKSLTTRIKRLLQTIDLPAPARYASYMRLFDAIQLQHLLPAAFLEQTGLSAQWLVLEYEKFAAGRDAVQTALAVDRTTYLPGDLLTKLDRASMLHALEVRSPFMDHELVRFASALSSRQLLKGGPKRMLRLAFENDLPRFVFKRKKMGFAVPVGQWFRKELKSMLHGLLFASDSFASTHFAKPALQKLLDEHDSHQVDHSQRLYALLMLELWKRSI